MKKKVISLLLTAAMATTMFAGCGSSSEENTTADNNQTAAPAATEAAAEESTEAAAPAVSADGKIAMITDSGDITDESFNQITWETCVAYGDKNGIEYQYYKPAEDTDEERINAIDLAVADGATVIVMPGYLFGPAIAEEQDLYPDVSFIAVDVTEADIVDLSGNAVGISDNVYICSFQEEQAGYLAGYAAVKDGYTSLGFLGGIAVPAVDGNVLRVISRVMASTEDILKPATRRKVESLLQSVIPQGRASEFNQGLIETGAIVCVPNGEPKCMVCPFESLCLAHRRNLTAQIPVKTPKKQRRIEERTVCILEDQSQRIAIGKRPDQGLLAGLYELPNADGQL